MYRHIQISKLLLSLSLSLLMFEGLAVPPEAVAAIISIDNIPLGRVIAINGQKFAKVRNDSNKGSQFIALTKVNFLPPVQPTANCPMNRIIGTMQTWNSCASITTPAATAYTDIGCLVDERDGKPYEIRKFSDGKCWMVDNLAYGGATDACASKTTFAGNGSATPTNIFGTGTYGNCRDPRVGAATSSPCYNSTTCGYYYNWQAAMQHASAYYGVSYTGPTTNVQGICPQGWHLPSGNTGGEFATLDIANGGIGASRSCNTSDATCNFWRPGYNGKQVYSGGVVSSGSLYNQGSVLRQWSASENSTYDAWYLSVDSSNVLPGTYNADKDYGFTVRCIKN